MSKKENPRRLNRRDFLKLGGGGAFAALMAGTGLARVNAGRASETALERAMVPVAQIYPRVDIRLTATDGFVSLPGRRDGVGDGLVYVFGYRGILPGEENDTPGELIPKYKGRVQWPSPVLQVDKDIDLYVTMTNLGLDQRPDLDDAHTIHWHGFRNPNAIWDGVPEVSVSVPPGRDFPYYYRPRDEGTFMYHCHFEDVEHVQMGMDGIVFVNADNGRTYDGDGGATAFDRQYTLLLNDVDLHPHDNLLAVQEFLWSDYKPTYWIINGRSYPDTLVSDQELAGYEFSDSQPVSSLIQLEEEETGLLRIANLGYEMHTMQLLGIPMTVVGHDANYRAGNTYMTHSLFTGPGESRDVLITAPAYNASLPGGLDWDNRPYNEYWFRNRNAQRLVNGIESGLGGMVTQVWVYPDGTLSSQSQPNQTV